RIERWLATARVFLAISALVAVLIDPGEIHYSLWASGLFAFYIAQGVVIILLLRRRRESTASFRGLVHGGDVVWPALISVFAASQSNPFFLFLVFVLAAAAYRWGLWETVGTAAASVVLLWIESLAFHLGFFTWAGRLLLQHHLPMLRVAPADFEPQRLFMRSMYLLVMGLLLGYLAEQRSSYARKKRWLPESWGRPGLKPGLAELCKRSSEN